MYKHIIAFKTKKNRISYLHDIGIQIYNKLVNMGLSIEISFHECLLKITNRLKYLFACIAMYIMKTNIIFKM
jgi:hypothetical protein